LSVVMVRKYLCKLNEAYLYLSFKFSKATNVYTLSLHDALPIFGVMAELLGVGEVILEQAHAPVLQGGGDLVVTGAVGQVDSARRSEEHTSELQSRFDLVCRLLLEKKKCLTSCQSKRLHQATPPT